MEPDEFLLIKVRPNVPLHQPLTDNELDLHAYFGEDDDSDAISEYSLLSEEEDPFTPAAAKDLLLTLAERNKQQAKLQAEATKLLKKRDCLKKQRKRFSKKHWGSRGGLLQYLRNCMNNVAKKLNFIKFCVWESEC